jgi:predicted O-methyltransferase YrrM
MSTIRQKLKSIPGLQRSVQSARWLWRLLCIWRSPNRQFLIFPPGHFYSPLPDYADVERALNCRDFSAGGIDLNANAQLELLRKLSGFVQDHPFESKPRPATRYFFDNGFFFRSDALALHAMLRHYRPRRVVEVGSGHSSALMLDTRDRFLEPSTQFVFIDPDVSRLQALLSPSDHARVSVLERIVQEVNLDVFASLEENDILFVDSSHVSKAWSDLNCIVFEILPALRPGVIVHFHDIFWPFEYPADYYAIGRSWNESYLLRAFLQFNSSFEVTLFLSFLELTQPDVFTRVFGGGAARSAAGVCGGGSSLWLRKKTPA